MPERHKLEWIPEHLGLGQAAERFEAFSCAPPFDLVHRLDSSIDASR